MTSTAILAFAVLVALGTIQPAAAARIDAPPGVPIRAAAGSRITVRASGFKPGAQVFVEQCDGTQPSEPQWSPAEHCDLGSSPAPVIADARGAVTFAADDPSRGFRVFGGESPQSLFNCVGPGIKAPSNALPVHNDCQLRVSTNNLAVTADQVLVRLALLPTQAVVPTTTKPGGPTTIAGAAGAPTTTAAATAGGPTTKASPRPRAGAKAVVADSGGQGGTGVNAEATSTDTIDVTEGSSAAVLIAVGVVLALACILLRRRDAGRSRRNSGSASAASR